MDGDGTAGHGGRRGERGHVKCSGQWTSGEKVESLLGDTARGRGEARQSYAHRTVVGGGEGGLIHRAQGAYADSSAGSTSAVSGSAKGLSLAGTTLATDEFVGEIESVWCTGGEVACGML